jgi:hypothetical protein
MYLALSDHSTIFLANGSLLIDFLQLTTLILSN